MHSKAAQKVLSAALLLLAFSASGSLTEPKLHDCRDTGFAETAPVQVDGATLEGNDAVLGLLLVPLDNTQSAVILLIPCDSRKPVYRFFRYGQLPLGLDSIHVGDDGAVLWIVERDGWLGNTPVRAVPLGCLSSAGADWLPADRRKVRFNRWAGGGSVSLWQLRRAAARFWDRPVSGSVVDPADVSGLSRYEQDWYIQNYIDDYLNPRGEVRIQAPWQPMLFNPGVELADCFLGKAEAGLFVEVPLPEIEAGPVQAKTKLGYEHGVRFEQSGCATMAPETFQEYGAGLTLTLTPNSTPIGFWKGAERQAPGLPDMPAFCGTAEQRNGQLQAATLQHLSDHGTPWRDTSYFIVDRDAFGVTTDRLAPSRLYIEAPLLYWRLGVGVNFTECSDFLRKARRAIHSGR